jgi:hypothetical protein
MPPRLYVQTTHCSDQIIERCSLSPLNMAMVKLRFELT